eukprot:7382827-Prymnesium_polylepis.1
MGTLEALATWAAVTDAPEHVHPIMALTPAPAKASWTRLKAPESARDESHLESLKANSRWVLGNR